MVFTQLTVGFIVSKTVTEADWLAKFPLSSNAVRVTVFIPKSLQLKLVISKLRLSIVQLSALALSISEGIILTEPVAFR